MIGQSHSGHGQGPRPWSNSNQKQSACLRGRQRRRAAAASAGGGGGRARGIGGGGARLARAVGETKIFFSVSSNPGRGGKKFFFEKSMEIFFRVEASRRQWNEECFLGIWLGGFFGLEAIDRVRLGLKNKNPFFKKQNKRELIGFTWMTQVFYSCQGSLWTLS